MRKKAEEEKASTRRAALTPSSYLAIDIPRDLGIACSSYKWRQTQSHVEIFVPLPDGMSASKVSVTVSPTRLSILFDERPILKGTLYRDVKAEESTWYIQDGVLEVLLLKRSRRGHYAGRDSNADTFWVSVVKGAPEGETLALQHPPTSYYWSPLEDEEGETQHPVRRLPRSKKELEGGGGSSALEAVAG